VREFSAVVRSVRTHTVVVLVFLLLAFAYDLTTPRGFTDWAFYLLAVLLTMRIPDTRVLFLVAALASLFTVLGIVFSPPGQPVWMSAISRFLGLILIWTAVFVALRWRRADERLRRLDRAVTGSGEIVFMTDTAGVITFINPAFTEAYGYTPEEVAGKTTPRILKSGRVAPEAYKAFWATLLEKRAAQWEILNKTKDGRLLTVEASASAILDERGKITGFLALQRDITERKQAEETLRKSETGLAEAQRIAHFGNWEWDIVNDRARWSEEMYRIFGLDPAGAMPNLEASLKLMHPDDRGAVEAAVKAAIKQGKPYTMDYRIARPDGSERIVHAHGEVVFDAARKPVRMVGIVQDITERRRAEERLRSLEQRFSLAFNAGPEPMTISNLADSTYVDVNQAFLRVTGYRREEIIGKSSLALRFWAFPEQRQSLLEGLRKGPVRDFEITFLTKSGEPRTGNLSAEVIEVEGQRCLLATTKDITERKQAEVELKRLNRALRTISDCNQALVRAGDETELLNKICQILVERGGFRMAWVGYAVQDEAKSVRPVVHAGEESGYLSALKITWADEPRGRGPTGTCIRTGQPAIARHIQDDPSFAPWREEALRRGYASSIGLPLNLSGKTTGALMLYSADADAFDADEVDLLRELADDLAFGIIALRNRDERERAEKVLKKTHEQLLQAQKMEAVGRLAGGVAHDFNNLLTVINGYADLLLDAVSPGSAQRGQLEEIKRAGERATSLTRQLLAFSRKQVFTPRILSLNAVVEAAEDMLHRLLGEDIGLTTSLAPSLGHIKADPGQIEQVIMNLVVNARDAMPKGGRLMIETANVKLDEEYAQSRTDVEPGNYVLLTLSDTGCGMDAETQSHVFEPFFTTKARGKGTGLGLSTAYGIIKQSGGHVNVYSEVGRGTAFKIYFKRVDEPAEAKPPEARPAASVAGTETILLVEDEPAVRALAEKTLRACGYTVLAAGEYIEALALSNRHSGTIHLLVTDVIMPGLNGRELAECLRALRPHMRVLFISGYTADAIAQHGILDDGVAFLPKPFSPRDLLLKVRQTLGSAKA
jgi:two-component system cell cycle sensor histidine kinase/response regulator CckA